MEAISIRLHGRIFPDPRRIQQIGRVTCMLNHHLVLRLLLFIVINPTFTIHTFINLHSTFKKVVSII